MLDRSTFSDETSSSVHEGGLVEAEQNDKMYTPSAVYFCSDVIMAF